MEKKDLLGGKGANLAEMTSVLELPVPPGFTITTDACRAYLDGGWPASLDDEVAKAVRKVEKAMGKKLGDPADPLLVSVRSGAKFSMPGMMDTVLNLGLNDESVEGLAAQTGDARFAYDSYRRFISMYGRIVLDLEGARLRPAARHGQGEGRRHRRRQGVGRHPAPPLRAVQGPRREGHRQAVPAGPHRAAPRRHRGGVPELGRRPRHRLPRARAHPARPRHRGERADDGVRQPRRQQRHRRRLHPRRVHRREQALRRLPRQRPGRGRGGRHPQHRGPRRAGAEVPEDPQGAAGHLRPAREALPRHVRHGVHHRAGQALDAPDPRRQAHRRRRAAHGRGDDQAEGLEDQPDARRCCASRPTTSTRCCTRSSRAATRR